MLADDTPVSLGVLGANPQLTMFGLNGPVKALAITEEQSGGVVAPEKAPTIVGVAAKRRSAQRLRMSEATCAVSRYSSIRWMVPSVQ